MAYSYGLPGWLIWSVHIIVGAALVFLGQQVTQGVPLSNNVGLAFVALGALMAAYHAHLWFLNRK